MWAHFHNTVLEKQTIGVRTQSCLLDVRPGLCQEFHFQTVNFDRKTVNMLMRAYRSTVFLLSPKLKSCSLQGSHVNIDCLRTHNSSEHGCRTLLPLVFKGAKRIDAVSLNAPISPGMIEYCAGGVRTAPVYTYGWLVHIFATLWTHALKNAMISLSPRVYLCSPLLCATAIATTSGWAEKYHFKM